MKTTTKIIIDPLDSKSDVDWQEFFNDTKPYPDSIIYILPYNYNSILVTNDSENEHLLKSNKDYFYNGIQREYITLDDIGIQTSRCLEDFKELYFNDYNYEETDLLFIDMLVDVVREEEKIEKYNLNVDLEKLDTTYNLIYSIRNKELRELNKKNKESLLKKKPNFIFISNKKFI